MCFLRRRPHRRDLDRDGLRPARYIVTDDDRGSMASEIGAAARSAQRSSPRVAPAAGQDAAHRPEEGRDRLRRGDQGRAGPGATSAAWLAHHPAPARGPCRGAAPGAGEPTFHYWTGGRAFRYTQEDLKLILPPMATTGREPWAPWAPTRQSQRCSDESKLPLHLLQPEPDERAQHRRSTQARAIGDEPGRLVGPRPNIPEKCCKTPRRGAGVPGRAPPVLPCPYTGEDSRAMGRSSDDPFRAQTLDVAYPQPAGAEAMPPVAGCPRRCRDGGTSATTAGGPMPPATISPPRIAAPPCWRLPRASTVA